MKKQLIFTILLFTLLATYSCSKSDGTSTGNPLISVTMTGSTNSATTSLQSNLQFSWLIKPAYALPPPSNMQDLVSSTVTLSQFWFNISEIELKPTEMTDSSEVDGSDIEFTGPYTVDLFNSNPQPFATSEISQSSIRRIKYKTKKVLDVSAGNPADMVNYTLLITGSVAGKNFTIRSGEELDFETSGPNLVSLSSGNNLLLEIQTAEIFRKIDLTQVTNGDVIDESNEIPATNPCPDIDNSATDIYRCFLRAIQLQTKVGHDEDGDNELETGEDSIN